MPGVVQPTVLDAVHRTCKEVVELHRNINVNAEALQSYAQQLDIAAVRAAGSRASVFPIKFDSCEAEVNFLCLFHLLNFGSGYDHLLRASTKRGATETIQYGCFGLALSAARLDGTWMRSFSAYHVHSAFGIESKVEEELQPGISISKPGPLAPLASSIQSIIVETGKVLGDLVKSLGAFVLEHLDGLKAAGKPITAASLVEELADTFPGFQDTALYTPPAAAAAASSDEQQQQQQDAIKVSYLRKAQCLVADLGARFGSEDERFRWSDAEKLSADSGAVLPAILRQLGILTYGDELSATIDQQQQLPQGPDERAIRAAAVAAVDDIAAAAAAASSSSSGDGSSNITARELSSYLLSLVKEADGQQQQQQPVFQGVPLKPHVRMGTLAY